jgi:RNA 2',3'-cyclic 3'-phosphodiesterase
MCDPHATDHLRLFIALSVPEVVKHEVERARTELRRAVAGAGIRWTTRAQLHLTLRFLGNVEAPRVPALLEALETTASAFAPLQLRASGVGFFPAAHPPRVVWVGVRDEGGQLALLQRAIQAATADFTAEKPEQTFTGHLTLGRIKSLSRREAEVLARLASGMANRPFGEWVAPELELIRSQLSEQGATHRCIATAPLGQNSP